MPLYEQSRATGDRRWSTIGKREELSRAPGQSDNPIHLLMKEPPNVDDHPDRRIADLRVPWLVRGRTQSWPEVHLRHRRDVESAPTHRDDRLDGSIRYDAVVEAAVSLASGIKYQTLEALGEAIAIGLLRRFALIDTIIVGVSKFSPPIPHTLSKVGIAVRLARSDLANWPTAEALEVLL
jgi:7,8-dihydroneopterin aldolase/epimerase/oxygenase